MGWVDKSFDFVATSSETKLMFMNSTGTDCGAVIDHVDVTPLCLPVSLANGDFEVGPSVSRRSQWTWIAPGSRELTEWTVGGGGIDYKGSGYFLAASGSRSIDLASSPGNGSLSTTFATISGAKYQVQFQFAGNPIPLPGAPQGIRTMTVSAAGVSRDFSFDTRGRTPTDVGWTRQSFQFIATGSSTTVTFANTTPGLRNDGPALDDVSVVCAP